MIRVETSATESILILREKVAVQIGVAADNLAFAKQPNGSGPIALGPGVTVQSQGIK